MKCMHINLGFIALNVRDGTESKDPSIVFLSIYDENISFKAVGNIKTSGISSDTKLV